MAILMITSSTNHLAILSREVVAMTRDELILAMFNNTYSTQKELGEKLGLSQREVSRLLDAFSLKDIFERNKVGGQSIKSSGKNSVPADEKERIRQNWLASCTKNVNKFWPLFLEQGGEKTEEAIRHDYKYGITDRYVKIMGMGDCKENRQRINELLQMRATIDDMSEDDIILIGLSVIPERIIVQNRKFGYGLEEFEK